MEDEWKFYKAFNARLCCRGFHYEPGGFYEIDGLPVLCARGFHFCLKLRQVYAFYPLGVHTRICLVTPLGYVDESVPTPDKYCTNAIRIGRELTPDKCCTNAIRIDRELTPKEIVDTLEEESAHPLLDVMRRNAESVLDLPEGVLDNAWLTDRAKEFLKALDMNIV